MIKTQVYESAYFGEGRWFFLLDRIRFGLRRSIGGREKKGSFYRKSLIWFILTASLPGFITGIFIYIFGAGHIERDLSDMHQGQMEERVQNIDDQLSYLELDLSHWAFSPRFGPALKELDFVYHFQETWDISRSLVIMEGSHPLIQDVELFIQQGWTDPVLFKTGYYRLKNPEDSVPYVKLLQDERSIFWTGWDGDGTISPVGGQPVQLVHKIPGESTNHFGILVVTLNREKLVNLLKTMTPYNEGETFLLDDRHGMIISDKRESVFQQELRDVVLQREETSGIFLWENAGKKYSVSYGTIKRIASDWSFVSAAPMSAITSPVIVLSRIILIVNTLGLIVALAFSWMATGRVYSPVARLIRSFTGELDKEAHHVKDEFQFIEARWNETTMERTDLKTRLSDQLPILRTGFLLQLIQGHLYYYKEQDLLERMKHYGWKTEGVQFQVLHFALTGFNASKGRFSTGDESLVTFVASNIIEELAAECVEQYGVINFSDFSIGLLLMVPHSESLTSTVKALGEGITIEVNRILGMQVTITISRPTPEARRIAETFMEVERAAGFRQFSNQNQMITMEQLSQTSDYEGVGYPFSLELELLQTIRAGKRSETEGLLKQFMNEVLQRDSTEIHVQQAMLQLLGSIQHLILQSGMNTSRLFQGTNMFMELSQIREPGNMNEWLLSQVILPYFEEKEARASEQLKQIVSQTIAYIHEHYMTDLSLEGCADRAGVNSYTLSKLFKQVAGVNFIDYVTDLRIKKASQLLKDTDMKIGEIAESVGYQQRYFNRIFKKQVGVTPSQYREIS